MQKDPQILMFGGESEDAANDKFHTYGDLYLYSCSDNAWTQISSPKGYYTCLLPPAFLDIALVLPLDE